MNDHTIVKVYEKHLPGLRLLDDHISTIKEQKEYLEYNYLVM